ncbi:MAG TPA: radical SAM family heme chaperone HemW [Terriglobales bacterium]|nr:radical SAM family heme chaperone HemW [Terriglobales bacterium]
MPLGLYISVPFCKTKCSYCNFASGVFSREQFGSYVERVSSDMARAAESAAALGCQFDRRVDSVYLGGGTPSVLAPDQLRELFRAARQNFDVAPDAEITVECAPGTLSPAVVGALLDGGVNRVSLGVQSLMDGEAAAVGRLHSRATVLDDIARLRTGGISSLNVDMIAGLPHQTAASWRASLDDAIASGVPHVSVYMLEVDDDSRLGRELIAGGTRYHAHFVPDDEAIADFYVEACSALASAGVAQYEISNFARPGGESRHNLKYWTRQPYLGFGVDAHSMLPCEQGLRGAGALARENLRGQAVLGREEQQEPCGTGVPACALRFSTPDSLGGYLAGESGTVTPASAAQALEESFFLGLRLNRGVDLRRLATEFGGEAVAASRDTVDELIAVALLAREGDCIRLTSRGRLLSNEVFERFLGSRQSPASTPEPVADFPEIH